MNNGWMDFIGIVGFLLVLSSSCGGRSEVIGYNCSEGKFHSNSMYKSNRAKLFTNLQNMADTPNFRFDISDYGRMRDRIYGLIQCFGDVNNTDDCHFCITEAQGTIHEKCGQAESAHVWSDTCFLRYGSQNFTSILDSTSKIQCRESYDGSQPRKFAKVVGLLLNISMKIATIGSKMSAATDGLVAYGKAVCSLDLSETHCLRCLEQIKSDLKQNCSQLQVSFGSCIFNYSVIFPHKITPQQRNRTKSSDENEPYYRSPVSAPATNQQPSAPGDQRNPNTHTIWSIFGALLVFILVALFSLIILVKKNILRWRWRWRLRLLQNSRQGEFAGIQIYDYELLRHGIRNFDVADKLGEGAYGSVYKGILPDGIQIAVKRLNVHSKHGNDQFVNEANLISTVQHRNLVKLLGCCAERSEKLLVYEYLPNKSLDKILFNAELGPSLDWNRRKSIIVGIARGLAYLHEESQPRIVHRDIKAGNILLDDNYNAKISDFGLARLFLEYGSHVSTRVAGTFYVAPEYALRGQLTEKADIFSFGVLFLEIVSGRQNLDITLSPHRHFLLEWAWKLYELRDAWGIVDPKMNANYAREDIERSIQIGFLCVQGKAQLRPSMS